MLHTDCSKGSRGTARSVFSLLRTGVSGLGVAALLTLAAGCDQVDFGMGGGGEQQAVNSNGGAVPPTQPVDSVQRQQAYDQMLEQERSKKTQDTKASFETRHGRDKVVTVTITGVAGDAAAAEYYLNRKLFKAAWVDYDAAVKRASQQTEANRKAAEQQAVQDQQQRWGGNRFGSSMVWYRYQPAKCDLPYPTIEKGPRADGTFVFYVTPVINIDEFSRRFNIGNVTGVDAGNRALQLQSLLPDPVPDIDLEELLITHGKSNIATIVLTGVTQDKDKVAYYLEKQVAKLDPQINLDSVGPKKNGAGDLELFVGPATDLEALSTRIGFGQVLNVDPQARVITVAAKFPDELPPRPSAEDLHNERMKAFQAQANKPSENDREPRKGEDEVTWALRILKGGGFATDAVYKRLPFMKVEDEDRKAITEVLVASLPQATKGFKLESHLDAMRLFPSPEGDKAILALLSDTNSHTRGIVIKALGKMETPEAANALIGRLGDFFDKREARAALVAMGPAAEDSVLRLVDNPTPSVRVVAYELLAQIGTEKSLTKIRAQIPKEREKNARNAVKTAYDILKGRVGSDKDDSKGK